MAYTKFNADWQDSPSTATPITAAALEHIETGVDGAHELVDNHIADTTAAHAASAISVGGSDLATQLSAQAALNEIYGDHIGDTTAAHAASAISVVAAGFNGNLAVTDDTVQKVAQKLDDLAVGGGGYATVAVERTAFVADRTTTSSTAKTLSVTTGHGILVGNSITVSGTGVAAYDGTYTVTAVSVNTVSYTGGSSANESNVSCAGRIIVRQTATQRSTLLLGAYGSSATDATTATRVLVPGPYGVPAVSQSIGPMTVGAPFTNSYNDYQGEKCCPVLIPTTGLTFGVLRAHVQASSSAGVVRFGVRQSNSVGLPGQLVADWGTTAITGIGAPLTMTHTISGNWVPDAPGLYWLTCSIQTSNAGTPGISEGTMAPLSHIGNPSGLFGSAQTVGRGAGLVTGALPVDAPFSAPTNATRVPLLFIERSA
jgi:hypothetical protein